MINKQKAYLHVITLPFVISAAHEFLDAWIYWPITLICGMGWFGACVLLSEKDKS